MDTKEQWDKTTNSYISAPGMTKVELYDPAIIRHVGNVENQTLLDYGCGSGQLARRLKAMGAQTVIATDTSASFIDLAKAADPVGQVNCYHMQENALSFLEDASVDKALANLVFMMAPSVSDMLQSMQEIQRVLRPGGTFIYLITHPCFIERGAHDYHNIFEPTFDYMKEGSPYTFVLRDASGNDMQEEFFDYHYPLSTYLNTTIQAGLHLVGFEELAYPEEMINRSGISKKHQGISLAIVICCMKPLLPSHIPSHV